MKAVFNQMETEVSKCFVDKRYLDIEKKELSLDNDRLLEHIICQDVMSIMMHADSVPVNVLPANNKCLVNDNLNSERLIQENDHLFDLLLSQDIVYICVNSLATLTNYARMEQSYIDEYSETLVLKVELAKKEHIVEKKFFDEVVLRSKLDAKDVSIAKLKKHIESLKGKNVIENDAPMNKAKIIAHGMFKLDLESLSPKVKKIRDAHIDYIKHTQENADILRELVEHARARPLDSDLDSACKYAKRIQEVLVYVTTIRPSLSKPSEKVVAATPLNKIKTVRNEEYTNVSISQPSVPPKKNVPSKPNTNVPNLEVKVFYRSTKVAKAVRFNDIPSRINRTLVPGLGLLQAYDRAALSAYQLCLGHNLFSVGQFCDSDLEVAFRKHMCYVRNLDDDDLLSGSRDTNLYTISMDDMLKKTISSAYGFLRAKRVESINGKKYILVIVDDYSRFTWVKFLRSKDEAPEVIIKCLKQIQVPLNATVCNVRTYNGTKFVNQTLCEYYENVRISHQISVARTAQYNGVVERQNRTLMEVARTMLIFSKALLFLWAEAVNTTFYTQNRSLIRLCYNKTPYELMHDKKPDLSYLHVFGSLCYSTNDSEDLGKLKAKEDIGIFVSYAPAKKAFRIYNKRTRLIMETIHVTFDELTAMASEQFSSGHAPQVMTPGTLYSGLVPNPIPQQPYVLPTKND
ncbi:retrovirus-related pol polyprotein from transposon TNT 1-94 [Tanacetum coccineum]|uniref:Retrovirus-related pol polyprotein from transposon TNT 1-94 n=1 Tax=Tanacetum coccineum TaxID=301880 RepID=A0ABQ5CEF7_9ASTR